MSRMRKRIEKRLAAEIRLEKGNDEFLHVLLAGGLVDDPEAVQLAKEFVSTIESEGREVWAKKTFFERQAHPARAAFHDRLHVWLKDKPEKRKAIAAYYERKADESEQC